MASVTSEDGFVLPDMVADIFYFLDIYSYGRLPPHCEQRFLPCEIGCVRYSLRDGILADFHHFIDPGDFQQSQKYWGEREAFWAHCCPAYTSGIQTSLFL